MGIASREDRRENSRTGKIRRKKKGKRLHGWKSRRVKEGDRDKRTKRSKAAPESRRTHWAQAKKDTRHEEREGHLHYAAAI